MINFVYISDVFRKAWKTYIFNPNVKDWPEFSESFKEEFNLKFEEEKKALKEHHRPPTWYLNDKLGEKQFLFNISNNHYPVVQYEYTDNLPSFRDILINRAIEMRDMGKEIDIFYSGGLDSVTILLSLYEVCPKDQLHIIMGNELAINEYPKLFNTVIKDLKYTIGDGNLYGLARPDKNLFTTGCEADRFFGGTGYPYGRKTNKERYTRAEYNEDYEFNQKNWWKITRYTLLTQSFRYMQNVNIDKMDINNYQPFYLSPQIEKYAINLHHDRKLVWHTNFWSTHENFLKSKMWLRDFVFELSNDREYAYEKGKTNADNVQREFNIPLPTMFNVLAITEDGVVVNKNNIMDFMTEDVLTIHK